MNHTYFAVNDRRNNGDNQILGIHTICCGGCSGLSMCVRCTCVLKWETTNVVDIWANSATPAFVNRPYETIYRIGINGNYNSHSHTRTTLWYNITQANLMRLGYRLSHNWYVTATMGLGHSRKWHALHIVLVRPIDFTTIKWIWYVARRTRKFNNRITINSILC